MTSHLLQEGILDVKDPKGSEDRKFWRAWRRQWISFSVVCPSGRREPFLLLNISHDSTASPEREIKLGRDGLRLFRCRSKSRPYRTWAITSGNKVVLYFAAETEMQAQDWMQSVRDGLWPQCFSFQMLTACSYEVSLIDDDNTFLAGHLGVYGRFVLTSEDIISLMHPHWGSTLLEISLDSIKDVVLVRETEVSSAGVFSILLKRVGVSEVKALQFFCKTAKDAIQWIMSKLYTRKKSLCTITNNFKSEEHLTNSMLIETNFNNNSSLISSKNENSITLITNQSLSSEDTVMQYITNPSPVYENLLSLNMKSIKNASENFEIDENLNNESITQNKSCTGAEKFSTVILDESEHSTNTEKTEIKKLKDFYINGKTSADDSQTATANEKESSNIHILSPNFCDDQVLTMQSKTKLDGITHGTSTLLFNHTKTDSVIYATVNKPNNDTKIDSVTYATVNKPNLSKKLPILTPEKQFSTSEKCKSKVSETNRQHHEFLFNSPENIQDDTSTESYKPIISSCVLSNGTNQEQSYSNTLQNNNLNYQDSINERFSNDGDKLQDQHLNKFLKDDAISTVNHSNLLTSLPSEFLDTSLNFSNLKNKTLRDSSLSKENIENLLWLLDESTDKNTPESVYEDILDRKGTIYEEIDTSDDEHETQSLAAPELPDRPLNLEIPESLRLQKLSKNITQTLQILESTQSSTKEHSCSTFIKKIKDVNRIMKISPDHEKAKDSFTVESKLPIDPERISVLKPNIKRH